TFQACGDGHVALQIFATDFGLRRQFDDSCERSQCRSSAAAAGEQSVAHRLKGDPASGGEADAYRIGPAIANHGGGWRFTREESCSINRNFLRSKSSTRSDCGINLKSDRG